MIVSSEIRTGTPYIRGGGNGSYIDTGIIPDNNTRVIVWARNFNPATSTNFLFGESGDSQGSNSFAVGTWSGTSTGRIGIYYATYNNPYTYVDDAFKYLGGYHKYELDGKVFKVDDVTLATSTSEETITTTYGLHLFGRNSAGTHSPMILPADICACKIYKNNVLVRDFTPVESPNVGLYDAISDTVFTNAGTGSFTYGAFNPNAYTPLEYITTSGASAFFTPAIGSYSLPIVIKFYPTGTNKAWYMPLGARSQDVKRCDIITGNMTYSNSRLYSLLGDGEEATIMYTSSTAGAVRKDLVVVKNNNTFTAYYNNAAFGSAATFDVDSSYNTGARIGIGAQFLDYPGNPHYAASFIGNIYHVGLGEYNLVPAKISSMVGMYDTYNDIFYPSTTSTPFTAGPEI